MILCVTLNPCLDKTLVVPPWKPGDLVRGRAIQQVVGGKGNNVARVLSRLGRQVRPVTFLGGAIGGLCEELFRRDDRLDPLIVRTEASTRVILTVRTGTSNEQSAFFDPDPSIAPEEAESLLREVSTALSEQSIEALTLSGSSPCPATHETYAKLVAIARDHGVPVFLDTYGPALRAVDRVWPTVLQMNRKEAAGLLDQAAVMDSDIVRLLEQWARQGVEFAAVTDGPNPVFVQSRGSLYRATPPSVEVVNPIGSGDSMLAGLVDGWLGGLGPEAIIRNGLACAVANVLVWDPGDIAPAEVNRQRDKVRVERL